MSDPKDLTASPIVIGIAGHRHIEASGENLEKLQRGLRVVFRAFSAESLAEDAEDEEKRRAWKLRESLGFPNDMLNDGLPKRNPIWLISPMAVGSDTLSAVGAYRFYRGRGDLSERILGRKQAGENREGNQSATRPFKIIAPLAKPFGFPRERDEEDESPIWGAYAWPQSAGDARGTEAGEEDSVENILKAIRGNLQPDQLPGTDEYTEFVLPLGGRAELRRHTTYRKDRFPQWVRNAFGEEDNEKKKAKAKEAFPNGPLRWYIGCPEKGKALLTGKKAREHYRTGATYVALYCDVLVALWDGNFLENSVGTDAAVRIKLAGPEPETISHGPIFNWADAGPVVQVVAENNNPEKLETKKKHDPPITGPAGEALRIGRPIADTKVEAAPGDTCVIHPTDFAQKEIKQSEDSSPGTQGKEIFSRKLEATEQFNRDIDPAGKYRKLGSGYIQLTFSTNGSEDDDEAARQSGFEAADPIDGKLQRIAEFANRTDALATELKTQVTARFSLLFLMVALAAVFFDVYAHWYCKFTSEGPPLHFPWLLGGFIGLLVGSVVFYIRALGQSRIEERFLEYRSLAEALRVQLAWLGAGIPQSAALHYLQRHRGSLDWIRSTMASRCFPYEDGQRRFDSIEDPKRRLARLRYVRKKWVLDQKNYFRGEGNKQGAAQRERHAHHVTHIMGVATALVGFSAALLLFAQDVPCRCSLSTPWRHSVIIMTFLLGPALAIITLYFLHQTHHKAHGSTKVTLKRWQLFTFSFLAVFFSPIATGLLCTGWHANHPPESENLAVSVIIGTATLIGAALFLVFRFFPKIKGVLPPLAIFQKPDQKLLPYIPFVIALIAYLSFGLGHLLTQPASPHAPPVCETGTPHESHAVSDPGDSGSPDSGESDHSSDSPGLPYILLIGLPILWGALLVAWGEKQLHSEHANRYYTAGELFRLTDSRLDALLEQAGEILGDDPILRKPESREAFERVVSKSQRILYALGKEALAENAEWLLLHRARPLEFPLAG